MEGGRGMAVGVYGLVAGIAFGAWAGGVQGALVCGVLGLFWLAACWGMEAEAERRREAAQAADAVRRLRDAARIPPRPVPPSAPKPLSASWRTPPLGMPWEPRDAQRTTLTRRV